MMKCTIVLGTSHSHVFALALAVQKLEDVELRAVWEPNESLHAAIREKLGMEPTTNLDEVLGMSPAIALIGALPEQRSELSAKAVEAGACVLTDKPLALTHESLDQVIAAQKQHDRPVIVYYPYRGSAHVCAAIDAIRQGRIGKLVRVACFGPHQLKAGARPDWHFTQAGNGGAMIDIGSHHCDLCCHVVGCAPISVQAQHVNRTQPDHPEFQDYAFAQFQFPDPVIGHVEVDWLNPESMKNYGDTRFLFQGTTGKIEIQLGDTDHATIMTHTQTQTALDLTGYEGMGAWTTKLIDDLVHDRPTDITQDAIWLASRTTLTAFDSAQRDGERVTIKQD